MKKTLLFILGCFVALTAVILGQSRVYPDRWVAVALIIGNRVPIPVPMPDGRPPAQPSEATAPAKQEAINGGRIAR